MIPICCTSCQKNFSVEEALANKGAKCPGCGHLVAIPASVASPAKEMPTLSPSLSPALSRQPAEDDANNGLTHPPSNDLDATQGVNKPDQCHDSSLTDFLAPSQADDELGRLGKYRILKILGHGGMGVVFKAEDPRLKRSVAVKAMLPTLAASASAGQRFLREAQSMAAVEHDHIVRIYQVDEERGVPFLAMEFLKGEPLDERLQRDEKLPVGEVLRIGREIAEGLAAAHTTGLIHRDVKPANVWLEAPRGRVKILDFGLARAAAQDAGLTQQGAIIGTPAYMAPEQGRGEAVDARCDLFSLGCVLYRMCTGQQPFQGKDTVSTLLAVASHQPPPPIRLNAQIPRELSDLVMKLLEKEPDRRPASAAEVVRILEVLQGKAAVATAIAPVVPTPNANPWEVITESEPVRTPMATPPVKAKRGHTPLLVTLGLLALGPLAWWLATVLLRVETTNGTLVVEINDAEVKARIKNGKLILTGLDDKIRYTLAASEREKKIDAGAYKIRVEGADGLVLDTTKFTLKKDGKITVRVTMERKAEVKNLDPDRKAADWVLHIGGVVRVNGQEQAVVDLPREAFRLTWVDLVNNNHVSDTGLVNFKGCMNLTDLNLADTQVGDTGLANFRDCKNLTDLNLSNTKVSDAGLANFKDCMNLTTLALHGTQVSDEGLVNFSDCKNLTHLNLDHTRVSDKGLTLFKDCKNLTILWLWGTQASDMGLVNFKGCKNLTDLNLADTQVGDAGLANFNDCNNLTYLYLNGTKVSDAGLAHLKDCKNLKLLRLWGTKVSDAGLAHFKNYKNLTDLNLGNTRVSDEGLALFKDCKNLTILGLDGTKVSDIGLAHFKDCKNLTELWLGRTQVSDAGLAHFKECKNLTGLLLDGTQVRNEGLAHFKDCKKLTRLGLVGTQVSDAGLAYFKDCKNLTRLGLAGTQVGDEGLAHFKDCKNLTQLYLQQTKVTAAKILELKKALPKCRIEWDGGVIEPKEK